MNLVLGFLSASMIYLMVRELLKRLPDLWSRFAALVAFTLYVFTPMGCGITRTHIRAPAPFNRSSSPRCLRQRMRTSQAVQAVAVAALLASRCAHELHGVARCGVRCRDHDHMDVPTQGCDAAPPCCRRSAGRRRGPDTDCGTVLPVTRHVRDGRSRGRSLRHPQRSQRLGRRRLHAVEGRILAATCLPVHEVCRLPCRPRPLCSGSGIACLAEARRGASARAMRPSP